MARPPAWRHTLNEARRQALVAVDFYNRPGDKRSLLDFVVHMHLAWQDLLHADLMRRGQNIFYKESNGRYRRINGAKVSWDLAHCLRKEFADNDPTRYNVEFFIGLRHCIEHRYQESIVVSTAPEAHAYVLNFERELVVRFGAQTSLSSELRFPVFVQSLTPEGVEEHRALRQKMPASASSYITQFQAALDESVKADSRFAYRVLLLPMKGPKTEADMAFTFVRRGELSDDELSQVLGGSGSVIVAEKFKSVPLNDELLPAAAAAAVEALIPFRFEVNDFTRYRQRQGIGLIRGKVGPNTQDKWAVRVKAVKAWVYTPALVRKAASELGTRQAYAGVMDAEPRVKESAGSAGASLVGGAE